MKCPTCGAEMKPLATSVYCPNDCDRVPDEIDHEKTPRCVAYKKDPTRSVQFVDIGFIGPPDPKDPPDQDGKLDWLNGWLDEAIGNGTD